MRFLISLVESRTFSASRRISAATMEKPLPASPARLPSSAALSASRSERSAISSITSTTVPMRSTRLDSLAMESATATPSLRICCMAWMNSPMAPRPARAAPSVSSATRATRAGVLGDLRGGVLELLHRRRGLVDGRGLLGGGGLVLRGGREHLVGGRGQPQRRLVDLPHEGAQRLDDLAEALEQRARAAGLRWWCSSRDRSPSRTSAMSASSA